jgi:hypothetical protein
MSTQQTEQIPAAAIMAELQYLRETIAQLCSVNGVRLTREQVCDRPSRGRKRRIGAVFWTFRGIFAWRGALFAGAYFRTARIASIAGA